MISKEEFLESLDQLVNLYGFTGVGKDVREDAADKVCAYVEQLITPEECKRRCLQAYVDFTFQANPDAAQDPLQFNAWYAENYE